MKGIFRGDADDQLVVYVICYTHGMHATLLCSAPLCNKTAAAVAAQQAHGQH